MPGDLGTGGMEERQPLRQATQLWRQAYRHHIGGKLDLAIEIDSEFGNPYNDIGVYLMQQDKLDESISWLEKAKQAKRYEPRQFPFMNLGRIYLRQGRWWEALKEFEGAVRLAPRDVRAAKVLHRLRARLN